MGYAYLPKLKSGGLGRFWWIQWSQSGRVIRESTKTTEEAEARRMLAIREGEVAKGGRPIQPRMDHTTWEEAAQDLREHYEATGSRNLAEYDRRVIHLTRFFRGWRIANIDPAAVKRYTTARKGQGMKPATIRRELGTLTTLLKVAYENQKLARVPVVRKPAEGPARSGFFEAAEYAAVVARLPEDVQAALEIMRIYGWRKREALDLERRQLNLDAGTLRLDPGQTKTKEGRVVLLTPELLNALTAQVARVQAVEKRLGQIIPHLFPHLEGRLAGQQRGDFRKAWATACRAAGVVGRTRHDLRRTAVRTMEQQGIPRSVAMKLTGHRTENTYRRYAIVSDADLAAATAKLSGPIPHRINTFQTRSAVVTAKRTL